MKTQFQYVDSAVFIYGSSNRLERISYYQLSRVYNYDTIEYNSKGQLTKLTKYQIDHNVGVSRVMTTYSLEYDSKNKPLKVLVKNTLSYPESMTWDFTHDDKSNLSEITAEHQNPFVEVRNSVKYEYNVEGNVVKVFYKKYEGENNGEYQFSNVLARENLKFDNKATYYSTSKDLLLINTYLYGYFPSKNNTLQTKIFYINPEEWHRDPLLVNISVNYNNQGKIIRSESGEITTSQIENKIYSIKYACD